MKHITMILAILIAIVISPQTKLAAQGTWTQKADFGGAGRYGVVGFSIGSKGYLGTGWTGNTLYKDFWEYDPTTNAWTQKADLGGVARYWAVGFSIGSKGYLGTGNSIYSGNLKDFWEYDPSANTWTQKADFAGSARYHSVGFSIGNKGYLGLGGTDFGVLNGFWEYDPATNTWTQKADFGGGERGWAVGFSIGSKGYVTTGVGSPFVYKKDLWEYNPSNNTWTQKADLPGTARMKAVGFSIGSKGYIGTGYNYDGQEHFYKDFWEYDPIINTWTQKTDFGGDTRDDAAAFSIGSKGYIGTGYDNSYPFAKDLWEYTPDCNGLTLYTDADGDGYGDAANSYFAADCIVPEGYVYDNTDCNDDPDQSGATIHPGACDVINGNGIDDNCNGIVDDGFSAIIYYTDADGDGYGTGNGTSLCSNPGADYSIYNTDCNDANASINPGVTEVPNDIDDNCNGIIDDVICPSPANLSVARITGTSAKLKWDAVAGAEGYKVRYKVANTSEWKIGITYHNNKPINGLLPNTAYKWEVQTFCQIAPNVMSEWSSKQEFTTGSLRTDDKSQQQISFQIYPNPAEDHATIQYTLTQSSHIYISVFDASGKEIATVLNDDVEQGAHTFQFNIKDFPAGIYFVKMISDSGILNQKLVVQ